MKAVVLAAGKGSRLGTMTATLPKPMFRVGGEPILGRLLGQIAHAGVTHVYMNLHHLPEVIRNYCGDGSQWNIGITYAMESEPLGTAGSLKNFEEYLRDDDFCVFYGDNYFECRFDEVISVHKQLQGMATIALFSREDVTGCGVVELDADNRITRFVEKPAPGVSKSHLINGGMYVLSPAVLPIIPPKVPCDFGYDVFPTLIAAGLPLYGKTLEGAVWGADTPTLYNELTHHVTT